MSKKEIDDNYIDSDGFVLLMGSLIRLTSQDLRFGDEKTKQEATEFIDSEWFCTICDSMGLNSDKVKYYIVNSRVKTRGNYE